MGLAATEEQFARTIQRLLDQGFTAKQILAVVAEDRAYAKHEHVMRMALTTYDYAVRNGRFYSQTQDAFLDDIIRRGEPPMPRHVIDNLLAAQRLLTSGAVSQLVIMSPSTDFAAEGSIKGQAYFMRRVGDRVLVVASDHSRDPKEALREAAIIYGFNPAELLAGNSINGGGVFGATREGSPTRREIADVLHRLGRTELAGLYERAIDLGKDVPPEKYMSTLIARELDDLKRMLVSLRIDLNADPARAIEAVLGYVGKESHEIRRLVFDRFERLEQIEGRGSRTLVTSPRQMERDLIQESPQRTERSRIAVMVDTDRLRADPLYRHFKERELEQRSRESMTARQGLELFKLPLD